MSVYRTTQSQFETEPLRALEADVTQASKSLLKSGHRRTAALLPKFRLEGPLLSEAEASGMKHATLLKKPRRAML